MDVVARQAALVIERVFSGGPLAPTAMVAREVAQALRVEGLLARCSCPRGFGHVRDPGCVAHGERRPAHTITGPACV